MKQDTYKSIVRALAPVVEDLVNKDRHNPVDVCGAMVAAACDLFSQFARPQVATAEAFAEMCQAIYMESEAHWRQGEFTVDSQSSPGR